MDFGLNEQQEMLQKSAREFLTDQYSDKILKEMAADPRGYTPELWSKMAELGWTALSIPEAYGGIGDFIDLCLILQEMGRSGLISPFFSSLVLGAGTIQEAGSEEQKQQYLPVIAEGKSIVTLALLEKNARYIPETVQTRAVPDGSGYILDGEKLFVPDANSADYLIVAARTKPGDTAGGITLFMVDAKAPGVTCNLLDTIAPDKQCEVRLQGVKVTERDILGKIDQGWPVVEKVMSRAAVAACAQMVGGAEKVLEFTLAYAKDRNAFGHPIGAYQAIQHRCADMVTDVDTSRFITYQAAWRIVEGLPSADEAAIAKGWVGRAFRRVVTSSHQIHGAIGFTQDHVLHWYTKRARSQDVMFGDVDYQMSKLAGYILKR